MTAGGADDGTPPLGASRPRYQLVDALRGAAIIGVVFYHLFWDLSYFWLIETDVSTHPVWVTFARFLLGTFVALAGVSLVLAHGRTIRWPAFWRRLAVVGGAAILVSVGTYIAFPETFVYFGVLHAIALFSLVGLAFLTVPLWVPLAAGVLIIALPLLYSDPVFTERALSWIGFWPVPPPTNDLVPVFPWLGVTLLGIAATRFAAQRQVLDRLGRWTATGPIGRTLVRSGRWSLWIYLLHQLVLLAIIYPLATFVMVDQTSVTAFNRTCQVGCVASGSSEAYCTTYCACALDAVETNDLWEAVQTMEPTPEQTEAVNDVVRQCTGAFPPLD
jgi:uncharacterized membrane protein